MTDPRAKPEPTYPPQHMLREEAARFIGVSLSKFDRLIADGLIPSYTEGRSRFCDVDDLRAYCRSRDYHPATVSHIHRERRAS